jgi:protein-disulfide isomerase
MSNEAKILTGIGIITVAIVIVAALFLGGKPSPAQQMQAVTKDQMKILVRPDSHEIKSPGAKVTLVEFGDFECPACGASYPIVTQLLQDYKGKINFVFRNYPLDVHPNSHTAAEAAEAAGAQGKFFEMYNALYSNQKDWGETNKAMDYFTKYAQNIGLDVNKFKNDVNSKKYASIIEKDQEDGNQLGINATPTFFINGKMHAGGLPYADFKQLIDAAMK